ARPPSAHDYRLALDSAAAEINAPASTAPTANPGKPATPVAPFRPPSPPRHLGKNQHQSPAAKNALVAVILAVIGIVSFFKLAPTRPDETTPPGPTQTAAETPAAAAGSIPDETLSSSGKDSAAVSATEQTPASTPAPVANASASPTAASPGLTPADIPAVPDPAMTAAADPIPFSQADGEVAVTPPPTAPKDQDEDWLDPNSKPTNPPTAGEPVILPAATEAELAAWNPDWTLDAPKGDAGPSAPRFSSILENDRKVLLLTPHSALRPAILSKRITLPATGPQQLTARIAAPDFPKADWLLKAFADDQPLSAPQVISRSRFQNLTWDLTPWKGKTITLRLENHQGSTSAGQFPSSQWAEVKLEPLSLLLARATFDPAHASKSPPEPGFVDLFDARQAPAWKPNTNGGLSFTEGVATPFTKPGATSKGLVIFTKRAFRDFILKVEFRMDSPKADSGLWVRLPDPAAPSSGSTPPRDPVEIEIHGDTLGTTGTGSIAGEKAPTTLPLIPDGWNKYELAVTGTRHLLKLNGVLINEYIGKSAEPGLLALQFHQGDSLVHYRNCWIRETTSSSLTLANPAAAAPKIGMAAAAGRPLGVPPDATPFNGKWYRFYEEKMLWRMAKKRSEDLRGHLVFIPDAATNEFLTNLCRNRAFWAGATDEKSEGRWLWLDGTPLDYNNWGADQPDNSRGREDFLLVSPKGSWIDNANDGTDTRGFICEWD
ncbi:MAG: hypothetical protein JWL81_1002, partial [Verrucomicrobiales bacterium]|nr:hypothetical protein [Verrucomicrobiales bacterium]